MSRFRLARSTRMVPGTIGVTVLALLAISLAPTAASGATQIAGPYALVLSSVPPRVPADGQTYGSLVVSLVNSSGLPVVSLHDLRVYLSSDLPSVGSVSPVATIRAGHTFVVANITTSTTPGTTNVTATATGLRSASAVVRTVIPSGFPDHLVVFGVPSVQLARASSLGEVVVQVQDDLGIPARTSSAFSVSVSSSDNGTLRVSSPTLTLPAQASVASENYTTGLVTGSASVTASASGFTAGSTVVQVVKAPPLVLRVTAEPGTISPASTGRVVVSLLDQNGDPAEAPADIQVFLTSSNLTMVTIAGTVGLNPVELTIPKNHVYAYTTFSSGSVNKKAAATITASAHGLVAGFATVSVVKSQPSDALTLYLAPDPVPSNQQTLPAIGIGLTGHNRTSGLFGPSLAQTTFPVVVTASDSATGKVIESVTIPFTAGSSYAVGTFNSTLLPSTTVITAAAQNLASAQATMSTLRPDLPIGPPPTRVVVTPVLSSLPADGNQYQGLLVSLQDSSGGPAVAPAAVSVRLALSRPDVVQLVGTNGSLTVKANQSFAIVPVRTLSVAGVVNVTAGSPGYGSSSTLLATKALSPAKLALFVSPSPAMLSSGHTQALLAVQLQDATGNPARARTQTSITLVSSNSSLLGQPLILGIQARADYRLVTLNATVQSKSVITAISPGLRPANATFVSFRLPLGLSLSFSSQTIYTNQTATVTASLSVLRQPLQNATVTWHVTGGTLSAAQAMTGATGVATAVFHPSSTGLASVYVTLNDDVIGAKNSTVAQVIVQAPPVKQSLNQSPTLVSILLSYLPYIGAGVAAIVVVAIFVIRRRRGGNVEEEDTLDIGPAAGEGTALDLRGHSMRKV